MEGAAALAGLESVAAGVTFASVSVFAVFVGFCARAGSA
jgi:hypothetical protein